MAAVIDPADQADVLRRFAGDIPNAANLLGQAPTATNRLGIRQPDETDT